MNFVLSQHAQVAMQRRQIPLDLRESVLYHPQQIVSDQRGNRVYQSILDFGDGQQLLVRAAVADALAPAGVIPVYRTSQIAMLWEDSMKGTYSADEAVLHILFSDAPIAESSEEKPGVIFDYDAEGQVVSIEILNASQHVLTPRAIEYELLGVAPT